MNATPGANSNSRLMNSLIAPLNMVNNAVKNVSSNLGNFGKNVSTNLGMNIGNNGMMGNSNSSSNTGLLIGVFVVLVIVGTIVGVLYYFQEEVKKAWNDASEVLTGYFNPQQPQADVNEQQKTPEEQASQPSDPHGVTQNLSSSIEKVLPGGSQVFNVSSNKFTYYDAAPLCKALGAELATYDQVKEAWAKGADWCNYGWVKGQMAVYPTSDETFTKLQGGPDEQRMACGRPGVNGGYFDNPEMRFGVNCYGNKPPQSKHDAVDQAKGAPISPDALAFDKKVNQYKSDADNIGLSPFNNHQW